MYIRPGISVVGATVVFLLFFGCLASGNDGERDNDSVSGLGNPMIRLLENSTVLDIATSNASPLQPPMVLSAPVQERPMADILECDRQRNRTERQSCYDEFIAEKITQNSTAELLLEMDAAADTNNALRISCHDIAHAIGRNTFYRSNGSISDAFNQCVQTCHAGCYHGILQAFFLGKDALNRYDPHFSGEEMRTKVKSACNEVATDSRRNFQCLHGMGHAIEFFVGNNLTGALDICDELGSDYSRQSCYGGVFMENVVSVDRETRWINASDPLYPCDALDERYKYECYLMQTSIIQEIFGEDDQKVIDSCKAADGGYVKTCFTSFGRDRSNYFRVGSDRPYRDIEKIPEAEYRTEYVRGLIYALLDNTWDGFYAFPFCSGLQDQVQDAGLKTECYRMATSYLSLNLATASDAVRATCEKDAPEADRELCSRSITG